jgi:hypothetical protein
LSSVKSNINPKLSAFSLFIFTPLFTLAQISGIWYGELENDSTHKKQSFEIGLSEYKGKITGFTYTTFISNDTFYFSVKRIKAERKDSVLVVVDDEMLYNNFPERVSKGVRQTTVFPLINDSTIDVTRGRWSTNQTKRYYSIAGSAVVKEVQDKDESELVSHLQEIKVKNNLAVRNPEKQSETAVVKTNVTQKPQPKPSENKKELKNSSPVVVNESVVQQKSDAGNKTSSNEPIKPTVTNATEVVNVNAAVSNSGPNNKIETPPTEKTNTTVQNNRQENPVLQKPIVAQQHPNQNITSVNNTISNTRKEIPVNQKPTTQPQQTNTNTVAKTNPVTETKPEIKTTNPVVTTNKISKPEPAAALPQNVAVRKSETIQSLYFHGDSLVLSLYDNGVVDGDTVSVFMNGNPIISQQQLKVTASKKTIYITPEMDSVQIVLFADNLGSIPPNTGLLTVRDGDNVYNVRFSADLQKNAAIVLRRKK